MRPIFPTLVFCLVLAAGVEAGSKQPVLIVSASTGNADVFVIDPETGKTRNLTNNPAADTMPAWSPAGNQIVFSSDRAGGVNLFILDLASNVVRQLTCEKSGAQCGNASWSPDGKRIAYHCRQGAAAELRVMNVDGSDPKVLIRDGWEPAWSPDGRHIAFGRGNGGQGFELCVMDADGSNVRRLAPPAGNRLGLVQPAWSPDGRRLVYTDFAGSLELFLVDADGSNRRQLTWVGGVNTYAAWGPSATQVTFVHIEEKTAVYAQIDSDGTRLGLSLLAGFPFREVPVKMGRPAWRGLQAPAVPAGAMNSLTAGAEAKCTCVGRLNCGHGPVNRVAFAPDGKTLATAHNDGTLGLCECRDGVLRPVHVLNGHIDCVWGCDWSPDGRTLASGGRDRTVCLWEVERGGLRALDDHKAPVPAVVYAPDGKTLVTGSLDRCVKVRDAETGKPRYEVTLPGDRIQELAALAISPDGQTLIAGGGIWTIPVKGILAAWHLPTGQPLWSLAGDLAGVWCLAFAPDGKSLALACLDGTIRLCDPATGKTLAVLKGHQDRVIGVAFTPDGKTLASCGQDNTLRLWDVATGRPLAQRAGHLASVKSIVMSSDRKTMVSVGADGCAILWQLGD